MADMPKMTSYFSRELMISILVPEEWTGQAVNESKLQLFAQPQPDYDDYRPSMSYVRGVPEGPNIGWLEETIAQSGRNMQASYNQFKLVGEDRFMSSSDAAVYVRRYEWQDVGTSIRFSQIQSLIWVDAGTMYLVNAATQKPLEREYLPIFDAILRSTRIIRRAPGGEARAAKTGGSLA